MMTAFWKTHPRLAVAALLAALVAAWYGGWYAMAQYRLSQTETSLARRDFEAAEASVTAAHDAWPWRAETLLWSARVARLRKQPTEAFRRLDEALARGADVERVVLERYLLRAERGELPNVEKKLLAYVHKAHADTVYVLDTLSWQWMMTHRLSEALHVLEQWLKLRPGDREALVRRAWTLERLRDMPSALGAYQEALDLDPERDRRDNDRIRLRLADLLIDRFRPEEALAHYKVLIQRHPDNPDVVLGLARCELQQGQVAEALERLENLLQAHPKHGKAMRETGKALVQLERFKEAEAWLRKAWQTLPADRAVIFGLEQCLEKLGDKEGAKKLRQHLDRIQADERAMAGLMRDINVSPKDAALRQRIGEIFLRNGLVDDGLLWLGSALFFDADYVPAHEVLAEWYEHRGENEKATPHREALTRLGAAKRSNRFGTP